MKRLTLTWWAVMIFLTAVILWAGNSRAETYTSVTFLPVGLSYCDAVGKKKGYGPTLASYSIMGGKKEGWQWINLCVYKHHKVIAL